MCWLKGEGYISKSNPNTISGMINATMAAERRSSHDYNASSPLYQDEVGGDDESWARDDFDDDEHNAVYDDDGYARRRYGGGDEGEEGDDERWGAVRVSAADVERYDGALSFEDLYAWLKASKKRKSRRRRSSSSPSSKGDEKQEQEEAEVGGGADFANDPFRAFESFFS